MNLFLIKLLLSFLIGGLYVSSAVWVSEKYGSKIGGLMIGLPSTLLISLIFLTWTQGAIKSTEAIPIAPPAIATCSIFLVVFLNSFRYGKLKALFYAILSWAFITFPIILFKPKTLFVPLVLTMLIFPIAIHFLNKIPYKEKSPKEVFFSLQRFLFRAVFSGFIISLAVLFGKILGPLWGGLFGSFPAAFTSSLLLLEKSQGIDFTISTSKTMAYGSIGNVIFSVCYFFLVKSFGFFPGIITSYLITLIYGIIIYKLILGIRSS